MVETIYLFIYHRLLDVTFLWEATFDRPSKIETLEQTVKICQVNERNVLLLYRSTTGEVRC